MVHWLAPELPLSDGHPSTNRIREGLPTIREQSETIARAARPVTKSLPRRASVTTQSTTLGPKVGISTNPFLGLNFEIAGSPWTRWV